jgi:hypothetical protein
LRDDSSTGILLRAAQEASTRLSSFQHVAIDHLDGDGLLAVCAACAPSRAVAHGQLLVEAAEAGDFCTWTGEFGYRLLLTLHQHLRRWRTSGVNHWETSCLRDTVERLDELVTESRGSRMPAPPVCGHRGKLPDLVAPSLHDDVAERDACVIQVLLAMERLRSAAFHPGLSQDLQVVPLSAASDTWLVQWSRNLGRAPDDYAAVWVPQDLPPIALSAVVPATAFQILVEETSKGRVVTMDAPRYSWARTVFRPAVAWPDLSALAALLQAQETGGCRWVARPEAAQAGFTTLLATVDASGGLAPSALSAAEIRAQVEAAMETR